MSVAGGTQTSTGRTGWTARRLVGVLAAVALVLCAVALLLVGATAAWLDTRRDQGYIQLDTYAYRTTGYAVVAETVVPDEVGMSGGALSLFGTARVRVTPVARNGPVFVGVAPAAAEERYLGSVDRTRFRDTRRGAVYTPVAGAAPAAPPTQETFWTARASGQGPQSVTAPADGEWTLVVMNADASRGVAADVALDATFPALPWLAGGLLALGVACLAGGIVLLRRIGRSARGRP